jgi:hypothetical protein
MKDYTFSCALVLRKYPHLMKASKNEENTDQQVTANDQ